jgi:hypothetical protein
MSGRGKKAVSLCLLVFLATGMAAQELILVSYQRNFLRANLAAKAQILRDAAADVRAAEFIGDLYEFALTFSLQNVDILRDDPDLITLTTMAARGAGTSGSLASVDRLWRVFAAFPNSAIRTAALHSLGALAPGNTQMAENINQ